MGVHLLGSLEVVGDDGEPIDIGGSQPRVILALLVAAGGKVVGVDALIDAIWEDSPPASASGTLQTYISRLRRALGEIGGSIAREPAGYRLDIDLGAVDVHRFDTLADEGRSRLDAGEVAAARSILVEAEQLWRGPALLEVRDRARIAGFARRLDDRRLAVLEDRLAIDLDLGRHGHLVAELAQLVGEHPLRERLWELLALARYRSGMQADALRAIADARTTLVESLGVEPGTGLRTLERMILAQDPSLDPTANAHRAPTPDPLGRATTPSSTSSQRPGRPPIVGRTCELSALRAALDEARRGRPSIVVVQGEAGVGKTRLAEELAAEAVADGGRVVWGRALEGGAAPAYWPWLAILRALRDSRATRADSAIDQLIEATGIVGGATVGTERPQLLPAVFDLLSPAAPTESLVVIVEDVQWADVESLELLTHVVSGLATPGVLLALTMRDGEEDARRPEVVALLAAVARRGGSRRLHVGGLDRDATAALLAHVSGRPLDDASTRVVHERVEGNPFFAIELQRLLDAEGIADAASIASVAVPIGVRDVIRQRLARLPRETLELLNLAAIVGREFDVELISAASGRSTELCIDALDVALDHRLLVDAGTRGGLRFSHALIREVVADELSTLRRARLHRAIADALVAIGRGDELAEIVAEHLWAAVPVSAAERAADALDRAAQVAIGRFAVGTATDLLSRSLELRRSGGDDDASAAAELDTLVKLVWALRASGGYPAALGHYTRGAELARRLGRDDIEIEMQWAEWASHDTACDFERARPIALRFRDWAASSGDPAIELAGYTAWAIQCWHDGDLTAAARAFALAANARPRDGHDRGTVSLVSELVILSTGFQLYVEEQVGWLDDPDLSFADAAVAAGGNFPMAIIWCLACTSAISVGDLERAERYGRAVLAAEAGETFGFWGSQARMYLGATLVATGRADEGRQMFDEGLDAYLRAGMRTGAALMLAAAASAEIVAGDVERAAKHLTMAQLEANVGERWAIPFVLLAEADVAEASGRPPLEVRRTRLEAEALARSQGAVLVAARAAAAADGARWSDASSPRAGAGVWPSAERSAPPVPA